MNDSIGQRNTIDLVQQLLDRRTNGIERRFKFTRNECRTFRHVLPYALQKLYPKPDEPGAWLFLNCDYKPLGIVGKILAPDGGFLTVCEYVDYAEYRDRAVTFAIDPADLPDLFVSGGSDQYHL